MKKRTVSALTLSSLYLCSAAWAGEVVELSTECESALALSAAPTYMRDKAGIYVLGQDGYEKIRASENGFACMVTREGPISVVPQCFDPIGQTVHMKVAKDEAKKMRAGMSRADIRKERVQGFYDGTYTPAKGHGVVYMASAFIILICRTGEYMLRRTSCIMLRASQMPISDQYRRKLFKTKACRLWQIPGPWAL